MRSELLSEAGRGQRREERREERGDGKISLRHPLIREDSCPGLSLVRLQPGSFLIGQDGVNIIWPLVDMSEDT